MRVRLGFAVAAHLNSEIMVIDEVLAVGDIRFQKKCFEKMNNISKEDRTILFVNLEREMNTQGNQFALRKMLDDHMHS